MKRHISIVFYGYTKGVLSVFLVYLSLSVSMGQEYQATLNWNEAVPLLSEYNEEITVPAFEGSFYPAGFNSIPVFSQVHYGIHAAEIQLKNTVYEPLENKKQFPYQAKDFEVNTKIDNYYFKKKPICRVYIPALRMGPTGNIEKLVSFTYHLKPQKPSLRSRQKKSSFKTRSVLANGDWYKLSVSNDGIYKIDYDFLADKGIDMSNLSPNNIAIYGNGGRMLPQENDADRIDDLEKNSIYISGAEDGSFDPGDYILFYGQSTTGWNYEIDKKRYTHQINYYTDVNHYFLTLDDNEFYDFPSKSSLSSAEQPLNLYTEVAHYEKDVVNVLESGRKWYGEEFNFVTARTFNVNMPDKVAATEASLTLSLMAQSVASTSFSVNVNGSLVGTQSIIASDNTTYGTKGREKNQNYQLFNGSSPSSFSLRLVYNKTADAAAVGYLDYYELNYKRRLRLSNNYQIIRSPEALDFGSVEYRLANASADVMIWDISDPLHPVNQQYNLIGNIAVFRTEGNRINNFVALRGTNFPAPVWSGKIKNSNLHGITKSPELVVLTFPNFRGASDKLASFKRSQGISTLVVETQQIYNEFSSGKQDITAIRDFLRMLFERSSGNDSLRYLLLMGDASYDYKDRVANNTNFVPIYQSRESLHNVRTYSSDDYFGFFDEDEGFWSENPAVNHSLDIGIGRLPVKNSSEAEILVNKIILYSSSTSTLGNWRNRISFVADDGDGNLHQRDAESLTEKVENLYPEYNIQKIYLDAFPQTSGASGEVSPETNAAINRAVENGSLMINYTGHGGESGWAQEAILTINQVLNYDNLENLPVFITATCEFGRYDDPAQVSGAELLLLNNQGGAIGLLTTTRPVYAFSNKNINLAFYDFAFPEKSDTIKLALGNVIQRTKNKSLIGVNNRNFSLLGDPSLTLAYPKENIEITKINDTLITAADTINALSKVTFRGNVTDFNGQVLNNFNGTLNALVFDKPSEIITFGNEDAPMTFENNNNIIYSGAATVKNGLFSFTFVVPKDINYQFDNGRVSLYALDNATNTDANGFYNEFIIGGTSDDAEKDDTPPIVDVFMNDESFVTGGTTGPSPLMLLNLEDDNGINIANTGIGHEITAQLDDQKDVIILNEFYNAEKDDFTKGKVEYKLSDLSPGPHSLKVKAWDTHNNSAESYLEFIVVNDEDITLQNILNYPNPFSTYTEFHFDHNRAGDDLSVMVEIYTVSGRLIKTLRTDLFGSPSHISDLTWNGRDDFGDRLARGVYVYKVRVKSLSDNSDTFEIQKLVILN